VLPPRGNQH